MKTIKGQIFDYIKVRPRHWKDIVGKFSGSGSTNTAIIELLHDGLIYKPARGLYEVRPEYLKKRNPTKKRVL
jgi:hypothetical protein